MKIFNKIAYTLMWYPRLVTIVVVLLCALIMFNGCATTVVKEKIVPVVETVEVTKIIPCKVEGLTCSFKGEQYLPTKYLLDCLIVHKKLLNICTGQNKEIPSNSDPEKIKKYLENQVDNIDIKFSK